RHTPVDEPLVRNVILAIAVEHRHVDTSVLIAALEAEPCRGVKQIRIEYDRPVLAIRNVYGASPLLPQKWINDVGATVVCVEVPGARGLDVIDDEPSGFLVQVGIVGSDPEVDVH